MFSDVNFCSEIEERELVINQTRIKPLIIIRLILIKFKYKVILFFFSFYFIIL